MPGLRGREAEDNLCSKGFQLQPGGDHRRVYFYFQGKQTHIFTYFSHSAKSDVHTGLYRPLKKQLKLDTNQQLKDLLSCLMSREAYTEILIERGELKSLPCDSQIDPEA